jgi:hypothetical protein
MRKTARTVVWEPWRAQSRQGHPIVLVAWKARLRGIQVGLEADATCFFSCSRGQVWFGEGFPIQCPTLARLLMNAVR